MPEQQNDANKNETVVSSVVAEMSACACKAVLARLQCLVCFGWSFFLAIFWRSERKRLTDRHISDS